MSNFSNESCVPSFKRFIASEFPATLFQTAFMPEKKKTSVTISKCCEGLIQVVHRRTLKGEFLKHFSVKFKIVTFEMRMSESYFCQKSLRSSHIMSLHETIC